MSKSARKQVRQLQRRLQWLNARIDEGRLGCYVAEANALVWALDYLEPIAGLEQDETALSGRNSAWKRAVAAIFGEGAVSRCKDFIAHERLEAAQELAPLEKQC